MLLYRVLTALAGIPVIMAAVWFGAPWLTLLAAGAAIIGVREAYRLYPAASPTASASPPAGTGRPARGGTTAAASSASPSPSSTALPAWLGGVWALALVLAGELAARPAHFGIAALAILIGGAIIAGLWMIAAWHGRRPQAAVAAVYLIAAPAYIGGALACAAALRGISAAGVWWLLLGILTVYAADTGAYAVGRLLGRHQMAPNISPGKNWEGAAGGMAGAVIAAVALALLTPLPLQVWQSAAIGVILGVAAPAGDLLESKVKRLAGAKDSGRLFPGHGGMLDRLDSLLPALIIVYLLAAASTPPPPAAG